MHGAPYLWNLRPTFPRVSDELHPWANAIYADVCGDATAAVDEAAILARLGDDRAMLLDVALPSVLFATEYLTLVAESFRSAFKGMVGPFVVPGHLRTCLILSARAIWVLESDTPAVRQERCAWVLWEEWKREGQSWRVGVPQSQWGQDLRLQFIVARQKAIKDAYPFAGEDTHETNDVAVIGTAGTFVDRAAEPFKGLRGYGMDDVPNWKAAGEYAYRTGSGWAHGLQWPTGLPRTSLAAYSAGLEPVFFFTTWEANYKAAYGFLEVAVSRLVTVLALDPPPVWNVDSAS